METSKVYFTNLRTTPSSNLLEKMERTEKRAGTAHINHSFPESVCSDQDPLRRTW